MSYKFLMYRRLVKDTVLGYCELIAKIPARLHSVVNQCKSYYGLKRLARNEVLIRARNIVKVTIPSIGVLPMYLFHNSF